MSTFFFADPHFGHFNIIEYQQRPFRTTDEMDAAMIENWCEPHGQIAPSREYTAVAHDSTLHRGDRPKDRRKETQGNRMFSLHHFVRSGSSNRLMPDRPITRIFLMSGKWAISHSPRVPKSRYTRFSVAELLRIT